MTDKREPTWSEIGVIAEAVSVLTNREDLPHDLLVELTGPLLRRLAIMGERIIQDPHGDSEAEDEWPTRDADVAANNRLPELHEVLEQEGRKIQAAAQARAAERLGASPVVQLNELTRDQWEAIGITRGWMDIQF